MTTKIKIYRQARHDPFEYSSNRKRYMGIPPYTHWLVVVPNEPKNPYYFMSWDGAMMFVERWLKYNDIS